MSDAESKWIRSREKHYLKYSNNCPICNSSNIKGDSMQSDATSACQDINCDDCGAEWTDIYGLIEVDITGYPTDLVAKKIRNNE